MALLEVLQYSNSDSNPVTLLFIFRMILGIILSIISYPTHRSWQYFPFRTCQLHIFHSNPQPELENFNYTF